MTHTYRRGSTVSWSWGSGTGEGTVLEVFTERVTRTLKGSEITRNGSDDNPAHVIEQSDGTELLKLDSEVEKA